MAQPLHERLDGQTALVTGANRGLGAQTCAELARLGARVFGGTRSLENMHGVERASGGQITPVPLDVTKEDQIQAAVAQAVQETGRLDIVVSNAGTGDWHGTNITNLDAGLLDDVLATNLRGPMLVAKHAVPHLLDATGRHAGPDGGASAGRVVNVSSGMGALEEGMSGSAPAYRVSKTGLNGLTAYLHGEYGPRGLIANSVCPGWVRTRMGGGNANRSLEEGADTIVWLARLAAGARAGRFWRDRKLIDW